MPTAQRQLETGDLARWASMVRENVNHHGIKIRATVPKVVGFVLLYHDQGTLQVSAGEKFSSFGSAEFKGRRLAFCYNHEDGRIDVREGNIRGVVIEHFDDEDRNDMRMLRFFRNLVEH